MNRLRHPNDEPAYVARSCQVPRPALHTPAGPAYHEPTEPGPTTDGTPQDEAGRRPARKTKEGHQP